MLDKIWSENELIEKLGLPNKRGKSRVLSYWIKDGLPCIEKGDRRFFIDEDVVEYLKKSRGSQT